MPNNPASHPSATLWLAECADDELWLTQALRLLNDSERQRYQGMRNAQRGRQFLMGRLLLRQMLSVHSSLPLTHWQLQEQVQQAPALLNAPLSLAFSISHSRQYAACLLAEAPQVGCDIEWMGKARDVQEIAAMYFPEAAQAKLSGLHGQAQSEAFYRMWTCHEAGVKAGNADTQSQSALWQDFCISIVLPPQVNLDVAFVRQTQGGPIPQDLSLVWTK